MKAVKRRNGKTGMKLENGIIEPIKRTKLIMQAKQLK